MGNLADYLTGDPAYDRAFRALSGCPAYPALESALVRYASEVRAAALREVHAALVAEGDRMVEINNWAFEIMELAAQWDEAAEFVDRMAGGA